MSRRPLTRAELDALVGEHEITPFLNSKNEVYRERGMKTDPPSREQALTLMAENPNLVRRPLLVADQVVFGFDEDAYRRALGATLRK